MQTSVDSGIDDLLGLSGRVAIVTGAASGYGRATLEVLARLGALVVGCDLNGSELAKIAADLPRASSHLALVRDVSKVAECEAIVAASLERFKRVDILVNAAAILESVDVDTVDEGHWQRTLDVNLKSQYFLSRAASRPMRAAKWGRIINFISTAGITGGTAGASVYGISKAGAIAMTKSFARAFARDNVLVNAISPASLRTPLFRRGRSAEEMAAVSAEYLRTSLLGRWTEPSEVALSVVYLASNMSSCVTGHILRADSGAGVVHP